MRKRKALRASREGRAPNAHAVKLLKGQRKRAYGHHGRRWPFAGAPSQATRNKQRADRQLASAEQRRKLREGDAARQAAKIMQMQQKAEDARKA